MGRASPPAPEDASGPSVFQAFPTAPDRHLLCAQWQASWGTNLLKQALICTYTDERPHSPLLPRPTKHTCSICRSVCSVTKTKDNSPTFQQHRLMLLLLPPTPARPPSKSAGRAQRPAFCSLDLDKLSPLSALVGRRADDLWSPNHRLCVRRKVQHPVPAGLPRL